MKYSAENKTVELSVGELCYISHRTGDIDCRKSYDNDFDRSGGLIAHKLLGNIKKEENIILGNGYKTEVPVKINYAYGNVTFCLCGRADGIAFDCDGNIKSVDEYKSVKYSDIKRAVSIHETQLKCYAFMLCRNNSLASIGARLVYCTRNRDIHSDEKIIKTYEFSFEYDFLRNEFENMLDKLGWYLHYADLKEKYVLPSSAQVPFPFTSLRQGQKELITECYQCIKKRKRFFAQAPTGIGKTISVLYPAIRALGSGLCDKIFYLTAKSSTRREAYNAAEKLFSAGAHFRTIVLSAKNMMCLNENNKTAAAAYSYILKCDPSHCAYTKNYNDKVKFAIDEIMSKQNCFTRGFIIKIAKKYCICPYELSLDLSELCDLIICDYNYAFDPTVYLRRYFSTAPSCPGNFVFLADEAHNLPERARDMYSASLSCLEFQNVYKNLPEHEKKLLQSIGVFIVEMHRLKKLCRDEISKDSKGNDCGFWLSKTPYLPFISSAEKLSAVIDNILNTTVTEETEFLIENISRKLHKFLKISEIYDESFLTYVEFNNGDIIVKQYCLDPSNVLEGCLKKAVSSIMFSATLTPPDYFTAILGCSGKSSVTLSLPSPFPEKHTCIIAVTSISTRYADRVKSIKKVVNCIAVTVCHKIGNYIIYFPSYSYMNEVAELFSQRYPNIPLLMQRTEMSSEDKKAFIDSFVEDTGRMRLGFCVLGGNFSEGIDLPGTRLIGTIIVGLGLPGLSNERNIIREYYENKYECGFDYAYTYPGMNNVLQAAGRVIRRESDRGVIVLIDDRYETEKYKQLYPVGWSNIKFAQSCDELSANISEFWKNIDTIK